MNSDLLLVPWRSRRHWRFPSQAGLFPPQHWNRPVISRCHEWSQLPLPACTARDPAVTETLLRRRSGLGSAVLHCTQQTNCHQQQTIWGYYIGYMYLQFLLAKNMFLFVCFFNKSAKTSFDCIAILHVSELWFLFYPPLLLYQLDRFQSAVLDEVTHSTWWDPVTREGRVRLPAAPPLL